METKHFVPQFTDGPDLEPIPEITEYDVWARLKKSSKYYHQGLVDPTNSKSEARFFKLEHFVPAFKPTLALCRDGYALHFNNNSYRLEDCELYLRDRKDGKRFLRIT